jgi:hypothetical protein
VLVRELLNYLAPGSEIVAFHDKAFEKTSQRVTVRGISGSSLRLESIAASSPHRANILLVRSGAQFTGFTSTRVQILRLEPIAASSPPSRQQVARRGARSAC